MKKVFFTLSIAALILPACQRIDDYSSPRLIVENTQLSSIPEVLAERSDDRIVLEFDRTVDESTLNLLSLTDYTETMPAVLHGSIQGAQFYLDRENASRVILDVSSLDRSCPIPVTLIYDSKPAPLLAHMMLNPNSSVGMIAGDGKKCSAAISDIHLNDFRSKAGGWAWFDKNQDYLINFIDTLIENKEQYRELVLLGDVIDEIVTPLPLDCFAMPDGTVVTEKDYFGLIAVANIEIIKKFRELQEKGIRLIYVPGNHDSGIDEDDVHKIFGPETVFVSDARGLGSYVPEYASEITMEHGHRYDVFNAPDRVSNIGIDNVTEGNAFMGPQYFITRISATNGYLVKTPGGIYGNYTLKELGFDEKFIREVSEDDSQKGNDVDNLFLTRLVWNTIAQAKYFPGLETAEIPTGLNGLTRGYMASQYSFLGDDPAPELYRSMYLQSEWEKRLKLNNAPTGFPFLLGAFLSVVSSIDTYAVRWLSRHDTKHRIFIWGHTHKPLMTAENGTGGSGAYIYANTGAWVDDGVSGEENRSFTTIYYGKDGYIQVCLKQMCKDGSVRDLYNPLWLKR